MNEPLRTDGELLAEFADAGSEPALAKLMARHGPMVHGVALRVLADHHEAQDVIQAVFCTLARKAKRLRKDASIGGWLHRVAWCLAMDIKSSRASRQRREEETMRSQTDALRESERENRFREELDGALNRLPERYRQPLVLFHIEGHSLDATAQMLGLNAGTVGSQLSRAREMLRATLLRRGVAVGSVGALTTLFSAEAGAAVLPAKFVSATVKAAGLAAAGKLAAGVGTGVVPANVAALTKGACNMLFWSSVKTAAVAATVVVVGGGAILAQQVAQREAVGSGEVILRAAEIPISVKDAKGEIYVAVPKQCFDDGKSRMWSFDRGMTDFYRWVFRLTEKEQAEMQILLEEAWSGADVLERCFTVTQDAQSVTAELRDADAVHLLQDVELRLWTNFLHKAAGVPGPGRAEVMNWFTARHRDIVPWPLSARPGPGTTRYRMNLSRVSGVSSGGIRFEIDTEGAPDGSPRAGGLSSRR